MVPETLTIRRLNRATLARQLLLERAAVPAVEAVERLAGMQAQEPRPPFLGLWTRVADFETEELLAALRGGEIVRATLMRATLHLASRGDYAVLRPALTPSITAALGVVGARARDLDPDAVAAAARELLADGPLRFDELRGALAERFPDADERVLGYATRLHLPLTMVPSDDRWGFPRNARFTLADPEPAATAPAEELVRRYLAAFGPAAATDVQVWSGLKGLKAVLHGMGEELVRFRDERGRELFDLPDAPRPDEDVPAPARLLPEFDNLVLSHDDRTRVIATEHRGKVVSKNLRVRATALWDGFAVGTWSIERGRGDAALTVEPFAALPRGAKAALREEGEALLRFAEPDAAAHAVRFA